MVKPRSQQGHLSLYNGYTMGWTTRSQEFDSRRKQEIFFFYIASKPATGSASLLSSGTCGLCPEWGMGK
jgi:hypothetical protein